jgi:hypothetical protein
MGAAKKSDRQSDTKRKKKKARDKPKQNKEAKETQKDSSGKITKGRIGGKFDIFVLFIPQWHPNAFELRSHHNIRDVVLAI